MRALRGMDAEGEGLQLIHADLHMGNTVRTGAGALVPIDFDDAGCGWLGYDVVASVPLKHPEHAAMLEAYLEGHGGEGLGAALEHLPTFYMARSLLQVAWLDHRAHVPKLRELAAERRATVCRRGHREASAR